MNPKKIIKGISLVLGLVALQACESDFTATGNDLIGGGEFDIISYGVKDLKAYNKEYGVTDGSRLGEVPFGYLNNGLFGATSSDLILQINESSSAVAAIGNNVKVDSVYLYVPYFSQFDKVEDKITKYKLKNVYGDGDIDVKVYQNGYHLMDVDLGDGNASKFFTNASDVFDKNVKSAALNEDKTFFFENKEIVIYKKDKDGNPIKDPNTGENQVKERLIPGMWLNLSNKYFEDFITEHKAKLETPNGFNEVFKGLYLKANVSRNGSNGSVGLLDAAKGKLVVILKDDKITKGEDGKDVVTRERKELVFALGANTLGSKKFSVNLFKSVGDGAYRSEIAKSNEQKGDETLYLKGGQGSFAILDFLRTDEFKELKELKESGGLLNDAYLTVFVDKAKMGNQPVPERLYLYDFDNSSAISDFISDNLTTAQNIKGGYNGILVKEDKDKGKEGYYYKFKITDHIRGLLKSKNDVSPKLALTVANNFASAGYTNQKLKDKLDNKPNDIDVIPSFTVSCPLGVALHGTNTSDVSKRMKLEIYYTKAKK